MATYSTSEFRKGLKIEIDGEPFVIVEFQHVKPGKGGAFVRTKLKSLQTGRVLERTFRSGESVQAAEMEEVDAQYLYNDGDNYFFMNTETYEQFGISKEVLGDTRYYLKDGVEVTVLLHRGKPLTVDPPTFVDLEVAEAEPGLKGDTASGAQKTVVMETGLKVQVPLFIEQGEILRIDTRTGGYVDRVGKA